MLTNLVAISVSLAEKAGLAIRQISNTDDLQIINKGNANIGEFDPQTEADRVSQCIIIDTLKEMYPKCVIIGEEGDQSINYNLIHKYKEYFSNNIQPNSQILEKCNNIPIKYKNLTQEDLVIWLDPLDGTSDFTDGLREHVTILIGIALKNGEPIAGIIHQPFYINKFDTTKYGRTIWGIVGVGAFNLDNLSSIKISKYVVVTSKTHVDEIVLDTIKHLKVETTLHTPGAGFKALQLMEKYVDAFVYPGKGTCKWDICATDAICRSLTPPLIVTDLFGEPFNYNKDAPIKNNHGILAASEPFHKMILEKIPQKTLDYLKQS